jgi:hypothetical protein
MRLFGVHQTLFASEIMHIWNNMLWGGLRAFQFIALRIYAHIPVNFVRFMLIFKGKTQLNKIRLYGFW